MARSRLRQAAISMALSCVFANRPEGEHEMLSPETTANKELTILAFSDVHGRVLPRNNDNWEAEDLETPPVAKDLPDSRVNQNLIDLIASGIIEKTIAEEQPDLLIYGGDMTTMIGDESYETGHYGQQQMCNDLKKACMCTELQMGEMVHFFKWFSSLGSMPKIVVSGNHDACFDFSIVMGFSREEFWMQLAARVVTDKATPQVMQSAPVPEFDPFTFGRDDVTLTDATATPEQKQFIEAMKTITYLQNDCFIWEPVEGMSIPILASPLSLSREGVNRGAFQYYPSSSDTPEGKNESGIDDLEQAIIKCGPRKPIVVIHGPPDNVNSPFQNPENAYVFDAIMKARPELVLAGHFHASTNPNFRYLHNPAIMSLGADGKPNVTKYEETAAQEGVPLYMTPMKQERPEQQEPKRLFVRKPVVCKCLASKTSDLKCARCAVPSDPSPV